MDLEVLIRDAVRQVVREELRAALAELRPAPASGPYLTVAAAAGIAAVSPDTVRSWISQGRLPRHNAGRELRVRRDELERFMAQAPQGSLTPEEAVAIALGRTRSS